MKFAIFWAGGGGKPEVKEFPSEKDAALWGVAQDKPLAYIIPMEHALGRQLAELLWGSHMAWIKLMGLGETQAADELEDYMNASRKVQAAAYGDCTPWQHFRPEMRK